MQGFKKLLLNNLKNELGDEFEFELTEDVFHNDIKKDLLIMKRTGEKSGVRINLSELIEESATMHDLTEKIVNISRSPKFESTCIQQLKLEQILTKLNKETILQNVFFRMRGLEKNKDFLHKIPHYKILDMAVTFAILVDSNEDENFTLNITDDIMSKYGLNMEELLIHAKENDSKNMYEVTATFPGFVFSPFMDTTFTSECHMYFISSGNGQSGATIFMRPEMLKKIAEDMNDDFYILPSSIHDVCIVDKGCSIEPSELKEIVTSINGTEVCEEEIVLTDSVYLYQKDEQKISIVS